MLRRSMLLLGPSLTTTDLDNDLVADSVTHGSGDRSTTESTAVPTCDVVCYDTFLNLLSHSRALTAKSTCRVVASYVVLYSAIE